MSETSRNHRLSPKKQRSEAQPHLVLVTADNKADHERRVEEARIGRLAASGDKKEPNYIRRRLLALALVAGTLIGGKMVVYDNADRVFGGSPDPTPITKYNPNAKNFDPSQFGTIVADSQHTNPGMIASEFLKEHGSEEDTRPYKDEISRQAGGAGNIQLGEEFHLELPKDHN